MTTAHASGRRQFITNSPLALAASASPTIKFAKSPKCKFSPQPGQWRTFDVTTRVHIATLQGASQVWLPIPCVDCDWQHSLQISVKYPISAKAIKA